MAFLKLQTQVLPNWRWGGTTATLRIFASQEFFEDTTGVFIGQGNPQQRNSFCAKYTCTVSGTNLTIPQVELATTTDSTVPNVTYTAWLYDESDAQRYCLLSQFVIDPDYIESYTAANCLVQIAGTTAARGTYTYRGQYNLKNYYNLESTNDSTANYAIIWTGTQWRITSAVGANYYYSTEDTDFPYEVVTWTASTGIAPVPTVDAGTLIIASTWENLTIANQGSTPWQYPLNAYWTIPQVKQYVDRSQTPIAWSSELTGGKTYLSADPLLSTQPIAISQTDPVWQVILSTDYLASYGCTQTGLDAAIADIGSAQAELVVTCNVTVSTNTTIPDNILVTMQGHGMFIVDGGVTLTINSMRTPSGQVFSGGNTVLGANATPFFDLTWWAGIESSGDDTNAFESARLSLVANDGGTLFIGSGTWVTEDFTIPSGSTIIGAGRQTDSGTVIQPIAIQDYIFGCVEGTRSISVKNLVLDVSAGDGAAFMARGDTVRTQGIFLENVAFTGDSKEPQIAIQADTSGWECLNFSIVNCFNEIPIDGVGFTANTVNSSLYVQNHSCTLGARAGMWDFDRIGFVDIQGGQADCGTLGSPTQTTDRTIQGSSGLNSATVTLTSGIIEPNDIGQPFDLDGGAFAADITAIAYNGTSTFTADTSTHAAIVAQTLLMKRYVASALGAAYYVKFSNEHQTVNINGVATEGFTKDLISEAGTYAPINITNCYFQSQFDLNESCFINSNGNHWFSNQFNDAVSTTSRIVSVGDYVSDFTIFGVTLDQPRLWNQHLGDSIIQVSTGVEEGNQLQNFGMPTRFFEGAESHSATEPILSAGSADETKPWFRIARLDSVTNQPDHWFDFMRDATDGYLNIEGNQVYPYNGVRSVGNLNASTFVGNVLSPTQIVANQNDYTPASNTAFLRVTTDASRNLTGLYYQTYSGAAGAAGEMHYIWNVGSFNLVIVNQSGSSTASYRFASVTGGDLTIAPGEGACLWYDATTARWRVWKTNITGLTSNGTTITGTLPTALTSTLAVTGALTASSTASIASTTTVGGAFDFKYVLTPSSGSGSLILGDTGSSNYIRLTETGGLGSGLLELNGAEVEIVGGSVLINGAVPLYSTNLLTKYLATTATYNNTAALANTALSVTVAAATKYEIELLVFSTSAVKALNMDFGGTSTQTSFRGNWAGTEDADPYPVAVLAVTSAGTDFTTVSLDGVNSYWTFKGTMLTNAGGTFLLRAAQGIADASNTTVLAGSMIKLTKLS